jgi:RNA polymerase sigma-70 factor (ECF subfamily)
MVNCSGLSDSELVVFFKADELSAFCEIYERYWKKLYAFTYRRIKDEALTEEILQDFFTRLWVKRETVSISNSLASFLFASIKNEAIDFYRKEATRLLHIQRYQQVANVSDNSTEQYINVIDLQVSIKKQVSQLPEKCRQVFELSRNENKSNKEIAAILGISEKTVENQITNALKRLRLGLGRLPFLLLTLSIFYRLW